MHVLFVPSWYATPENPIRGAAFRDQALALRALGHQVGLLVPPARLRSRIGVRETLRGAAGRDETWPPDRELPAVHVSWWGSGAFVRSRRQHVGLRAFDEYVSLHGRPEVIHAHSALYGGYLATAIRQREQIPFAITEHFSGLLMGFGEGLRGGSPLWPDQRSIVREVFGAADYRLAVSEPLAIAMRALVPGQPIEVLANCIDTDMFTFAEPPPRTPFRVLIVAGLNANKSIDVSLTAFQRSFGASPSARLEIVGRGPLRPELERLAASLGLAEQVEFLGLRSRTEVRDLMQASHVIVSSSRHETFGVSLIEAMACGRPVIASRSGGPQTFVEPSSGVLVKPGDVADLAGAMRHVADEYDRFDLVSIRDRCVTRFAQQAIGSRLVEIYEMLIARRFAQ